MLSTSTSSALHSTLPKLAADGSNWIIWKTQMQVFLGAKKFAQYLDASFSALTKPEPLANNVGVEAIKEYEGTNEKYLEWIQADTEAKHYIFLTIPDTLLVKTINCATSMDLWKTIYVEHEGKTKMFRMEMICRIHNERCTDADNIRTHFTNMVRLREELAATSETLTDENFASILTNSLPESYGNVISTAYTTTTMHGSTPTIQQIIAVVETEYSRRQISNGGLPGSVALFSSQQKSSSSKKKLKKKPVCTNTKCQFCHTHEFKDC